MAASTGGAAPRRTLAAQEEGPMDIRPSPIAGRWYPADASRLAQSIDGYLEAAQVTAPPGDIVGVIVPHAGHLYSGPVAAYAYQAVRRLPVEVVAIFCPSHFHADGALLTTRHAAYSTPLGTVPVDRGALEALEAELKHEPGGEPLLVELRRDREHAIEIQLPFLQRVLEPGFQLIPVMLREQTAPLAQALGEALARQVKGRRALVVGSSDLSHYYPQPVAHKLDTEMLRQVENFDPEGVLKTEAEGRGFACGHGAIAAALWAMRALGANRARVVRYATSGDVTGDASEVVGYGAAVVWKESAAA
jgi:AmmeMemoRadiSam system protein B